MLGEQIDTDNAKRGRETSFPFGRKVETNSKLMYFESESDWIFAKSKSFNGFCYFVFYLAVRSEPFIILK